MRPCVQLALVSLCALLSAVPARAAVAVDPPAATLVAVPADRCPTPDVARFAAAVAETAEPAWTLLGAPRERWAVTIDAERAAALGVPTPALREWLVARIGAGPAGGGAGAAAGPAAEKSFAEALLAGALPGPKKTEVPLNAIATLERGTERDVHVTLDGQPVVVARTDQPTGPGAAVAAAAALASACGAPLDAVTLAFLAPADVRWAVSYRTTIDDPAARQARAQQLEGAIAARREAGRTLGLHRAEGGAVWGFARGSAQPSLAPAAQLMTPGFHALVQRAERGVWMRPLQSVVRFTGPAAEAPRVYATAERVAAAGGPNVNVLLSAPQPAQALVPGEDGLALARAKLGPEDAAFALHGLELTTPGGEAVRVVLSPGTPRADVRLVGRDGQAHALGALGTLEQRAPRTATLEGDRALVYVGVPTEAALAVAKELAAQPPPESVQFTIQNWNVLPEADAQRILRWWRGE